MDSTSNGISKLLPKAIAAKRRRTRPLSTSSDDVQGTPQKGSLASHSAPASDVSSIDGSLNSQENGRAQSLESDPEFPTSASASSRTPTSSLAAHEAHKPDSLVSNTPSNPSVQSSTLPRDSTESIDFAQSLDRSRTALDAPQSRPKRSSSTSRLRDVFKAKKSSNRALDDEEKPGLERKPDEPPRPRPEEPKPASISNTTRHLSRGQKPEPLKPPRTPPTESSTPVIVNTPPTPTDYQPDSAKGGSARSTDASAGSMIAQRRRADSGAGPSKLSNIISAPLTPTPENGPASPNPAATFFSSMFSAVQNTANTLGATISNSTLSPAAKNKGGPPSKDQPEKGEDTVEVESATASRPSTEPKEPAVKTLGMGDLSLSHLGIIDTGSAAPSPVAHRFAESDTRARSDSAPAEAQAVTADLPEDSLDSRPRSLNEAAGGERTPPTGSLYEGKTGVHRSGSIRSAIGHRRNRGSSVATHGTTGTSGTIAAAIAAANSSISNPAASGSAPKLTGFAVANKKRNRDFHALFKSVPDDDYLIEDYSCALQREILAHGRLYVSEGHLCFSSNIFGWVTTLVMSFDEIVSVEKRSTALVFKNGLEISTLHTKHIFASFASRDTTYDLIIKIWKLGHPHLQSSLNGVRLEEPGGDRTEKIETASVSAVGSHSISGSDAESDDGDDVYDEDEDDEEGHDGTQPSDGPGPEVAEKAVARKVSGPAAPSEKPDEGAPASGGDFPGPATHAPTDCGDAGTHYDKVMGDEVIPAPLGKVYTLLFGPASAAWMGKWLTTDQKCTDLQMDDKRGLSEEVKSRTYSYIKPLSASIGPKQTKCIVTEQLDHIDLEKAVNVSVSTQNPDVPSGNIFCVKTKYCLTWAENNATRVQVNCTIEWSGKSWLKAAIERGANDGQTQFCKDLFAGLKAAVSSRPRTGINGAARGKKRTRKSKSAQASNLASDTEDVAKVVAEQNWGLFEPARPLLGPVVDIIRPILTGNVVYGLLVGLLVASWFGFGARPGVPPRYAHDLAYASYPQRMAAYEEMWRREESDLWEWLEERVGLDRLGSDPPPRKRSVDPRTVEERLREQRMDEREVKEAMRVTEEHLEVLKAVVDGRRAQKVTPGQ